MGPGFNHIAYAALDVCNALDMAAVIDAVHQAGLAAGATVLDIGTGNGAVAIRLAGLGLSVTAVEGDARMADLARDRIATSGADVDLVVARSGTVLATRPPLDLIVSIGAIEPAGDGLRAPGAVFPALANHLRPGGFLLWGDVVWKGEPPEPLRQMMELNNIYADDAGWRAAATAAGLSVVSARMSSGSEWDRYGLAMQAAAEAWLFAHPDHPAAPAVIRSAERVRLMLAFGRPHMDFGLYLFRKD